jgi:uncharacterized protein
MTDMTMQGDISDTVSPNAKYFPGIWVSIGWIVLYFALQAICTAAILIADIKGGPMPSGTAVLTEHPMAILWGVVSSAIIQLMLMWLYLRKDNRMTKLGLTHFGSLSPVKTMLIAVALVGTALVFNFVYSTYVIPGIPMQDDIAKLLSSIPMTPVNIAAGFFAIAVAAPVAEELLFRGFLQRALANYLPIWAALLLSSLAFALVHGQPAAIPALMALSMAFGYIYYRTGSLRTNIILHILNNAAALLLTQL